MDIGFRSVTHLFFDKLYEDRPLVEYLKQYPSLTHGALPSEISPSIIRQTLSFSAVPLVDLIFQSVPNLKNFMVYLRGSYAPERFYDVSLREWNALRRRVADGRLIVLDDIRDSDVIRCFPEDRSIWDNVGKWADWRGMDDPPKYRCRGNVFRVRFVEFLQFCECYLDSEEVIGILYSG
ncbi:hypothetical protein M422DRAFT_51217 [Sphaerobolus stellatus SS14]|uniref:Unplaced genomic scaffold SPHSTscaffold_106, whole genome shotgun sequence n=1 Tax=Sphaerobolus stellatus (strain SS14) TaxID=990650 RepID=A0A0C9V376_SPHS4|nr:hypothetical protein M422DRAFT_51217 [Sphaerobolus stellatus SS14]